MMKLELTDTGESPVLDTYMQGYEKVFTLPDESEDRDGFAACLALNHGEEHKRLSAEYGDFKEYVGVARDPDKGVVGGANFIAGPVELEDGSKVVTVHLNYAHIDEEHRRGGRLHELVDQVTRTSETAFSDKPVPVIVFLEQNDPLAMSREDYRRDTEASGIDQVDRMHAWSRLGAKIVDFPYVQPELAPGEEPNDTLALAAITKGVDSIPPEVLKGHLHRFFGVSVAKGEGLAESAVDQMDRLDGMIGRKESVALIDPSAAVAQLRTLDRNKLPEGSVRDYARQFNEANDNDLTPVAKRPPASERSVTEAPEQGRGLWARMSEGYRRITGAGVTVAQQQRAIMESDTSVEGKFANTIAKRYAGQPMQEVAKALPEAWRQEGLPRDKDAAYVAIATAARDVAAKHMQNSPTYGLDAETAREVRVGGLQEALNRNLEDLRGRRAPTDTLSAVMSRETQLAARMNQYGSELRRDVSQPQVERQAPEVAADRSVTRPAVAAAHAARAAGIGR